MVELFLNGRPLGKKEKAPFEYRLRWDDVVYEPGELKAVAYKNGARCAEEAVKTTGEATQLRASADRIKIKADGKDLSFITVKTTDQDALTVPRSDNLTEFSIAGFIHLPIRRNPHDKIFTPTENEYLGIPCDH